MIITSPTLNIIFNINNTILVRTNDQCSYFCIYDLIWNNIYICLIMIWILLPTIYLFISKSNLFYCTCMIKSNSDCKYIFRLIIAQIIIYLSFSFLLHVFVISYFLIFSFVIYIYINFDGRLQNSPKRFGHVTFYNTVLVAIKFGKRFFD